MVYAIDNVLAAAMMVAGMVLALRSIRAGYRAGRDIPRDPERALGILRGFRRTVLGLTLVGIGAAWIWSIDWLLTLTLLIAAEELLESTVMILAVDRR